MAKAFIPKVGFKDIDLSEYGGEGKIRVKGMTANDTAYLSSKLQELAKADGYDIAHLSNIEDEINIRYTLPMIITTIERCVTIEDEDGYRPLTSEEIEDIPPMLASEIYFTVQELNNFPLVQKDGAESKKEQSKPTSVE